MSFVIRTARPEDAPTLAALHVAVWRASYGDLAPQAAIDQLDGARRLPYWQATCASEDPGVGAFVANDGDEALGVVSFGPARDPALVQGTEIKHLYVAGKAQGSGIGRALLDHAFDHLKGAGVAHVSLAVVAENAKARAFYARVGGQEVGAFTDPGPLWKSHNIVVSWTLAD